MKFSSLVDRDYQREKLEFALALYQSQGDKQKAELIKYKIYDIGLAFEEPGT